MFGAVNAEGPDENAQHPVAAVPARVQKVVLEGLSKTKDDLAVKHIKPLLESNGFYEMVRDAVAVREKLNQLGIFDRIILSIDTYKGENARPDGYEVRFTTRERKNLKGGVSTQIGQNDMNVVFDVYSPNVFGRAEKIKFSYVYGTEHSRGFGVQFMKPVSGDPDVMMGARVFQEQGEYPWSGYRENDRGLSLDLSFASLLGMHNLRWDGVWRDLRCLSNTSAFAVREQAGHSLKSSIIHTFERDNRDDTVLPTRGTLLKIIQEYAGLAGNNKFFKHDVEIQGNAALPLSTVLQLTVAGGVVRSLEENGKILINDRFFLGGPLTLRGFNKNGVGPHSDGNALGGDVYCMSGLHLYTPLPFRPGKGGFGNIFRSHFFVNTGTCGNVQNLSIDQLNRGNLDSFKNTLRMSYGFGIVLRLGGIARVELNYVIPAWQQKGDSANKGVQLGIGIRFL